MIKINQHLFIDENELEFVFIRASGPGGQNVNKVATAVQLRFDVDHSPSLSPEQKQRLARLAGRQVNALGVVVIEAKRYRSQERNKKDAIQRLITLIQKAVKKAKKRIPTRAGKGARERRLKEKRQRGEIKSGRKKPAPE
jgi:ribosome-associated protein